MSLLFYWRRENFSDDKAKGRLPLFRLNQNNPIIGDLLKGERVWAVTYTGPDHYAVVAELIVASARENSPGSDQNGKYFFEADPNRSRYFDILDQSSVEDVIRRLSIQANAKDLFESFQGRNAVRILQDEDDKSLEDYAKTLKPDNRLMTSATQNFAPEAGSTSEEQRKISNTKEIIIEVRIRDGKNVRQLRSMYEGKCQICGILPFDGKFGGSSEAHHIVWLSKGGEDKLENMILLCANHHAAMHSDTENRPAFDRRNMQYSAGDKLLKVVLDKHLSPNASA